MKIKVDVVRADALRFNTDVLVLKYADGLYGVDEAVVESITAVYKNINYLLPQNRKVLLLDSFGEIGAQKILFVGVGHLYDFGYKEIRDFARRALTSLFMEAPNISHVSFTLHGVGYGLDETEAFESEIAGFIDAIRNGHFPKSLERISIIELRTDRANRLDSILSRLLPSGSIIFDEKGVLTDIGEESSEIFREVGYTSNSKPNIFVAMPFDEDMLDVYNFGVQGAVKKSGYLCERADFSSFTGDVMDWVKKKIKNATLLIADLTNANPNVYLEVGYAWGLDKPTILIVKSRDDLKFNTKGQRCLEYKNITDLKKKLCEELKNLKSNFTKKNPE